jgi:hypothetical protein
MAKAGSTWERPTLKPRYSRVNPRRRNDHTANKKHTSA